MYTLASILLAGALGSGTADGLAKADTLVLPKASTELHLRYETGLKKTNVPGVDGIFVKPHQFSAEMRAYQPRWHHFLSASWMGSDSLERAGITAPEVTGNTLAAGAGIPLLGSKLELDAALAFSHYREILPGYQLHAGLNTNASNTNPSLEIDWLHFWNNDYAARAEVGYTVREPFSVHAGVEKQEESWKASARAEVDIPLGPVQSTLGVVFFYQDVGKGYDAGLGFSVGLRYAVISSQSNALQKGSSTLPMPQQHPTHHPPYEGKRSGQEESKQTAFSEDDGMAERSRTMGAIDHLSRIYWANNHAIADAATIYGLEQSLLLAVMKVESTGDPHAVSSCGAAGLMQLMPGTARDMGMKPLYGNARFVRCNARYARRLENALQQSIRQSKEPKKLDRRFDPRENIMVAAKYLRHLFDRHGGLEQVLAGYYGKDDEGYRRRVLYFKRLAEQEVIGSTTPMLLGES